MKLIVIWSISRLHRKLKLNCYLVGFQASQQLTRIVTTPLGIAMTLLGIKGFCPLICNSLRNKLKLGNLQFVGEINLVEENILTTY